MQTLQGPSLGLRSKISFLVEYARACSALADGLIAKDAGRNEEALVCFAAVVDRFGTRHEPQIQSHVIHALTYKALLMVQAGDKVGALDSYTDLLRRFRLGSYVDQRQLITQAMFNRGVLLAELGEAESAIAQYEELKSQVDPDAGEIHSTYLSALYNQGILLMNLGRLADALQPFETLAAMAKRAHHNHQAAVALLSKGRILFHLGDPYGSMAIFREIVGQYDTCEDAAVQVCVTEAREQLSQLIL